MLKTHHLSLSAVIIIITIFAAAEVFISFSTVKANEHVKSQNLDNYNSFLPC